MKASSGLELARADGFDGHDGTTWACSDSSCMGVGARSRTASARLLHAQDRHDLGISYADARSSL